MAIIIIATEATDDAFGIKKLQEYMCNMYVK